MLLDWLSIYGFFHHRIAGYGGGLTTSECACTKELPFLFLVCFA
jgi:hypothetical protein